MAYWHAYGLLRTVPASNYQLFLCTGDTQSKTKQESTMHRPSVGGSPFQPAALRVFPRVLLPPLSLFLSGGFAARREDGLGGWLLYKLVVGLCVVLSVCSGVMPLSALHRPVRAVLGGRWPLPFPAGRCPWRMGATGGGSGASFPPRISSLSSLIWRKPNCRRFLLQSAMVVDGGGRWRKLLQSADRVRAHQQRCLRWSGGFTWLPIFIFPLPFMVEGRPLLFLPACVPNGRQFRLLHGGHGGQVMQPWRLRRPKWFVPGDGDVGSVRKLHKDPIAFLFSVWGPPCKSQGLSCVCYVSCESLCNMYCPTFF